MYCKKCDAAEETCCEASKRRQHTATTLAGIIREQSKQIMKLEYELRDARGVIDSMRAKVAR